MIEIIIIGAVIFGIYAIFGQFVIASWSAGAIAGMLAIAALVMFVIGRKPRAMTVLANQLSDAMRTGRNAVQDRGENNMCGGAAGSLAAIRQRTRMEGG